MAKMGLVISFLVVDGSILSLLTAFALAFVIRGGLLIIHLPMPIRKFVGAFSFRRKLGPVIESVVSAARMGKFAAITYFQRWFIFIAGRDLDLLMIGLLIGSQGRLAAEFIFAYKFAFDLAESSQSILLRGISGGFSHTLISEYYEKKDYEKLRRLFNGLVEMLCLTTFPAGVGLAILAPDLVVLFVPNPAWAGTHKLLTELILLFSLSYPLFKMGHLAGTFFPATDHETLLLKSRGIFSIMNISGNLILFYTFNLSLWAFAFTTCGVAFILFATDVFLLKRFLGFQFPFTKFLKFIAAAALMGLGLVLVGYLADTQGWSWQMLFGLQWSGSVLPLVLEITLKVMLGALIYFGMLLLLKPFSAGTIDFIKTLPFPFKDKIIRVLAP